METKQTVVEWLEEEFIKLEATIGVYGKMYELIKQAKEMEKDKAFEFWQGGINCTEEGGKSFEEYYTENYG